MFSEQVFVILKRKKSIALITEWGFTNVLSFENANQMKRSDQDKYLFLPISIFEFDIIQPSPMSKGQMWKC